MVCVGSVEHAAVAAAPPVGDADRTLYPGYLQPSPNRAGIHRQCRAPAQVKPHHSKHGVGSVGARSHAGYDQVRPNVTQKGHPALLERRMHAREDNPKSDESAPFKAQSHVPGGLQRHGGGGDAHMRGCRAGRLGKHLPNKKYTMIKTRKASRCVGGRRGAVGKRRVYKCGGPCRTLQTSVHPQ